MIIRADRRIAEDDAAQQINRQQRKAIFHICQRDGLAFDQHVLVVRVFLEAAPAKRQRAAHFKHAGVLPEIGERHAPQRQRALAGDMNVAAIIGGQRQKGQFAESGAHAETGAHAVERP